MTPYVYPEKNILQEEMKNRVIPKLRGREKEKEKIIARRSIINNDYRNLSKQKINDNRGGLELQKERRTME